MAAESLLRSRRRGRIRRRSDVMNAKISRFGHVIFTALGGWLTFTKVCIGWVCFYELARSNKMIDLQPSSNDIRIFSGQIFRDHLLASSRSNLVIRWENQPGHVGFEQSMGCCRVSGSCGSVVLRTFWRQRAPPIYRYAAFDPNGTPAERRLSRTPSISQEGEKNGKVPVCETKSSSTKSKSQTDIRKPRPQ